MENSDQNKENDKPKEDENSKFICNLLKGAVGVFIVVILLFVGINICGGDFFNKENPTLSNLGTIGDYFGGLINPLLGFVSFCALLYTIQIQMKSLAKQSEELELTREELEETRKELTRSAEAQEESAKTFKQQQFESTFFSLLNQIIVSIDHFHKSNWKSWNDGQKYHLSMYRLSQEGYLNLAWININSYDDTLPKIFILIYQLLKLIDGYESELSNNEHIGKEKAYKIAKSYSNILRSCLDRNFLQLFAINGCRTDFNNMDIYKGYIEKYSLLEHMSFKLYHASNSRKNILEELVGFYAPKAFDKSEAYKELMEKKNSQQQTS